MSPVPPMGGVVRQIDFIFLFHFNQDLVPYGDQANDACYVGLLKTLRKHPNSKFAIHISGTLMEDMQWFNNTALQLVRDGVADGQFEVIGSTYSQNIMYSTNMTDNDQQIKEHREIIEKIFGVFPKGFWNPERTWTQSFVPLLVDNGYEYTQVEDHILYDSGITTSEYLVRTTTLDGKQLIIFNDDKTQNWLVNSAIDSGYSGYLIDFLQDRYSEDVKDQFAICYFEDAEATGLWDYEGGEDPHIDWNNLDQILTDLENQPWIKITTYEEFLKSHGPAEDVSPIVDGAADWMGRDAWFDYNANDPGINAMRVIFTQVRDVLIATEQAIQAAKNDGNDTISAEKLLEHAWTTMIAHQYEFGCIGIWTVGSAAMELVRTALVSAEAARYALNPSLTTQITEEDINNDSVIEIVVKNHHNMFVFSKRGGRLLYWFDIDNGEELVGHEDFMYYGEGYTDDNTYVPTLRKNNPLWWWLAGNNLIPWDIYKRFIIRRRALNDFLKVNGTYIGGSNFTLVNSNYAHSINGNSIVFSYSDGQVSIEKTVTIPADGRNVNVTYSITYLGSGFANLELEIENSLCPSYEMVMEGGKDILQYWKDGKVISESDLPTSGTVGVVNVESGEMVSLVLTNSTTAMNGDNGYRHYHNVFGRSLIPRFDMGLNNGDSAFISLSLESSRVPTDPEFFKSIRKENGNIIVEVPTYVRKVILRYEQGWKIVNETMKYYGAHEISAPLPKTAEWYQIIGEDIYGNTKLYLPVNGTASFSTLNGALNTSQVHLECDLNLS
ncbi:MAG: polysaccharide deacetylase family protein, partial [Candidatus Poribacteria bacterium]